MDKEPVTATTIPSDGTSGTNLDDFDDLSEEHDAFWPLGASVVQGEFIVDADKGFTEAFNEVTGGYPRRGG